MTHSENFKNFLIIEGSYEKFCNNIMKQRGSTFEEIMRSESLLTVIDRSLSWHDCPEVDGYWCKINSKWRAAYTKGIQFNNRCRSIW